MTHTNAPLSIEGRRRLVERCKARPIAHVAAEVGVSRACVSKWVNHWRSHGHAGLQDRSSTQLQGPFTTPVWATRRSSIELSGNIDAVADRGAWADSS